MVLFYLVKATRRENGVRHVVMCAVIVVEAARSNATQEAPSGKLGSRSPEHRSPRVMDMDTQMMITLRAAIIMDTVV